MCPRSWKPSRIGATRLEREAEAPVQLHTRVAVTGRKYMDEIDLTIPIAQNPELQDHLIYQAVCRFNRLDTYLLEVKVDEVCMCGRLAFYVQNWLWEHRMSQYDADIEYNRGYAGLDGGIKRMDEKNVRLDMIVHKRGYDAHERGFENIICIEMKKASNREGCEKDEARLQKLTDQNSDYKYCVGYMLMADDESDEKKLRIRSVFRNGERVFTENAFANESEAAF